MHSPGIFDHRKTQLHSDAWSKGASSCFAHAAVSQAWEPQNLPMFPLMVSYNKLPYSKCPWTMHFHPNLSTLCHGSCFRGVASMFWSWVIWVSWSDFRPGFFKQIRATFVASAVEIHRFFTRFGELADYVYCTYCAALLLERMDRDRKEPLLRRLCFGPLGV